MKIDFTAISGILYLAAMVAYTLFMFFKSEKIGRLGFILAISGFLFHFISFIIRWHDFYTFFGGSVLGSVPITNLYESLHFFALLLMLLYIIFEFRTCIRAVGAFAFAISGSCLLFIDAIGASDKMQPLVPALQSNWLLAHVSLSFIAYVFFAVSAISAFIYLVLSSDRKSTPFYIFWTVISGAATSCVFALIFDGVVAYFSGGALSDYRLFNASINSSLTAVKLLFIIFSLFLIIFFWYNGLSIKNIFSYFNIDREKLDIYAYKFAVTGFLIFTIGGLIFGAIWAEQAWGRYWSWDPKETWAFVTWVVYGIYIHGRASERWGKILSNSIAVTGFIVTIFTYLGVNLFLSGIHSYGGL